MISSRTVACLGAAQLISWGITFYLIAGFSHLITAETGWTDTIVFGGFSVGLMVMGFSSPLAGRLIDRFGGAWMMNLGAILNALGCVILALSHELWSYFTAWIFLGLGMRLTLYDAAFAALARAGGPSARGAMAQITLLGGLASTVLWPVGGFLSEQFGWRGALLAYAALALSTIPLHAALTHGRHVPAPDRLPLALPSPRAQDAREIMIAGSLFAVITASQGILNAAMSAHMIGILAGLGFTATLSVWISTLRGAGQTSARLCEVIFGRTLDPLTLTLGACAAMPVAFVAGFFAADTPLTGAAFAFVYGATNGLLTITRGTMPLVLFDHQSYGARVGRLIAPSFIFSALAPLAYSAVMARYGATGGLTLSLPIAGLMFAAALILWLRFRAR